MFKPIDVLYREYQLNELSEIDLTDQDLEDKEIQRLIKYIEAIKKKEIYFEDIPQSDIIKLADLIYRE